VPIGGQNDLDRPQTGDLVIREGRSMKVGDVACVQWHEEPLSSPNEPDACNAYRHLEEGLSKTNRTGCQ
jgi:hypothetical protein